MSAVVAPLRDVVCGATAVHHQRRALALLLAADGRSFVVPAASGSAVSVAGGTFVLVPIGPDYTPVVHAAVAVAGYIVVAVAGHTVAVAAAGVAEHFDRLEENLHEDVKSVGCLCS